MTRRQRPVPRRQHDRLHLRRVFVRPAAGQTMLDPLLDEARELEHHLQQLHRPALGVRAQEADRREERHDRAGLCHDLRRAVGAQIGVACCRYCICCRNTASDGRSKRISGTIVATAGARAPFEVPDRDGPPGGRRGPAPAAAAPRRSRAATPARSRTAPSGRADPTAAGWRRSPRRAGPEPIPGGRFQRPTMPSREVISASANAPPS